MQHIASTERACQVPAFSIVLAGCRELLSKHLTILVVTDCSVERFSSLQFLLNSHALHIIFTVTCDITITC